MLLKIILCFQTELENLKEKFKGLETKNNQRSNEELEDNTDVLTKKLSKLQDELQVGFISVCVHYIFQERRIQ